MSGHGHRAALPAGGHSRPEYLAGDEKGALAVRHYNREGRVREYDFTALPVPAAMQASLAALFAARCTPDRWSVHATSRRTWIYLRQFAGFLDGLRQQPRDLDELTPELIRLWRESLSEAGGAAAFKTVSGLLRGDSRLREGHAADELARRYRAPRSTVQSYSEAEFDRITATARRQFRAALRRISESAAHLQRWREGGFAEGSADWIIGEGLDILARTGGLPKYTEESGERTVVAGKYRRASGGMSAAATWQRLFLSRMEAVALGVLLVAEYGWNLSVIDRAEVPLASPDQGEDGHPTYRIPLEKPRRGAGRHYETRNVTDDGAASRGRLITQALEATRFARALVEEAAPGTSRLIVWRTGRPGRQRAADQDCHPPVGPFRFGVHSDAAKQWARAEALGGSPFGRGRRTVIALDRREPGQHSQDTHDRHYVLPDKRAQAGAAEAIAAGAEDAAARARSAVLIAQMRDAPAPRGRRDSHCGLLKLPRQPLPVAGRRLRCLVPDVPGLPERAGPSRAPSPPRPPARGAGQPALRPAPGRLGGGLARCPRPPGRPPAAAGRRPLGAGPGPGHRRRSRARQSPADRGSRMTAAADLDPYLLPLPTPGSPVVLPHLATSLHAHLNGRYADPVWPLASLTENPSQSKKTIRWALWPAPLRDEMRLAAWNLINGQLRPTFLQGHSSGCGAASA